MEESRLRLQVLEAMVQSGVIPVFCTPNLEAAIGVLNTCARAGLRVLEWTNRGEFAFPVFVQLMEYAKAQQPGFLIGVGSIVDAPTAALYIAHGARFIVGPLLDRDVAVLCNKRKVAYSPGCATATEIHSAHELGVDVVKVFPGSSPGGASFVKTILGPMPWCRIMPTGGVEPSEASIREWFGAGIVCAGMGSKLITPEVLERRDWDRLLQSLGQCRRWIAEARGQGGQD